MRIAFILTSLNPGGIAMFTKNLIESLTGQSVHCEVILTLTRGLFASEIEALGVRVHLCPQRWSMNTPLSYRLGKLLRDSALFSFGPRLAMLLRQVRPDVVHSQAHGEHWASQLMACRMIGAPFLMQLGSPSSTYPQSWQGQNLFPRLFRECDRLVSVSSDTEAAYADFLCKFPGRSTIVNYCLPDPGSTDLHFRESIRADLNIPAEALVVGSVGRLISMKRYNDLIDAVSRNIQAGHKLHLLLVGHGPERSALETQAAQLGIREQVHFAGFQTNPHTWLSAMDAYVLPSLFEGLPVAILEAMAAGLPIIGTNVVGTRGVLARPNTGILVPPEDSSALAAAIVRLMDSPELRHQMGQAARAEFLEHYQMDRGIESYMTLYRDMIASRRQG
jgi:glycosyltransferase involved in cell wall biosynthesis